MAKDFLLPDIGEGLTEGEIVKWFVQEGQEVKEDEPLVEVMTEKVNVEIPSPYTGTVLKIHAAEGQVVQVGDPIITVGEKDEPAGEAESPSKAEKEAPSPEAEEAASKEEPSPPPEGDAPTTDKILAAPAVRRLARELHIDLAKVPATGARGRVLMDDVRSFAAALEAEGEAVPEPPAVEPEAEEEEVAAPAGAPAEVPVAPEPTPEPAATLPAEDGVERIPIRGIRRTISERMHRSRSEAAHFTYVEEVDVTELVALRERAKTWAAQRGVKLTYLPFILKALVATLKEHPTLNATVDWDANEVLLKTYYNLGIATATDQGLMVAVLRGADRKSVFAIAKEVEELSEKARQGKLSLHEVQDSTFTVTSLGTMGGLLATPIINPPEVAILGIHKIAKRPVVRDGQVVVRDMMNVSLSFDHRIIDGHVGAAFTQTLIRYLEDPGLLLLHVLESGE